jgi:peptidoglycan/LPS O-acetylase OafA/YrhL
VYVRQMGGSAAAPGRGIGPFLGRVALGIVTCGLLGLAVGMVFKLIWDTNCEHDCDVLWIISTVIGLLVGILVGFFAAIMDRRWSRRYLRVLLWAAGAAGATIVVALLLGAGKSPPPR